MKIETKGELRGILYNFKNKYGDKDIYFEYKDIKYGVFMGESERGVLTGYFLHFGKEHNYFKNKEEMVKYVFNSNGGNSDSQRVN